MLRLILIKRREGADQQELATMSHHDLMQFEGEFHRSGSSHSLHTVISDLLEELTDTVPTTTSANLEKVQGLLRTANDALSHNRTALDTLAINRAGLFGRQVSTDSQMHKAALGADATVAESTDSSRQISPADIKLSSNAHVTVAEAASECEDSDPPQCNRLTP